MEFVDLELEDNLLEALEISGFYEATPIQEQAIPPILAGRDLIGCAQTGTGKTGAFLIPIIQQILSGSRKGDSKTKCIIIVPTRELARQIYEQVEGFAYYTDVSAIAVHGGSTGGDWSDQKRSITNGVDMIVATPGRMIQHINMGYVDFSGVEFLVLDEADKMLEMGFIDDITRIANELPKKRQNLLFSATMPDNIRTLARKILHDPFEINIATSKPAEGVTQLAYLVNDKDKVNLLSHLIKKLEVHSMVIFAARKSKVDEIERTFKRMKLNVEAIHSDKPQEERQRVMREFANKQIPIVIATDILSRGIDVDNISHVVNFDCPQDPEDYVHRVGRTARYESTGIAITFINDDDKGKFSRIERMIGREIQKEKNPDGIPDGPRYFSPIGKDGKVKPAGEGRNKSKYRGKSGGKSGGGSRGRGGNKNRGRYKGKGGSNRPKKD